MTYVANATSELIKAGIALARACEVCVLPNLDLAETGPTSPGSVDRESDDLVTEPLHKRTRSGGEGKEHRRKPGVVALRYCTPGWATQQTVEVSGIELYIHSN